MRLKIEINSREHFSELGRTYRPLRVETRWFTGEADITIFTVNELLGTKLRALYQRKKGRDLFDLWYALEKTIAEPKVLVACFRRYLKKSGHAVSRAQFEANLHAKRSDPSFRAAVQPLLRSDIDWDFNVAMDTVLAAIIRWVPGEPWKAPESN